MINKTIKSYKLSSKIFASYPKRLKSTIKMIGHYEKIHELEKLFRDDSLAIIIQNHPNIYYKPFRPYLACSMHINKKIEHIKSHYKYLPTKFSGDFVRAIYDFSSIELTRIALEDLGNFGLTLSYIGQLGKEGEMVLSLVDENQNRIYSMVFSFYSYENELFIVVGGIQGSLNSSDLIRNLTKKIHGLRPRNLLIFALRAIAGAIGADKIIAICEKEHEDNCSRTSRDGEFQAQYNTYWEEEGGIAKGIWFEIPVNETRKTYEEISSNKRSMYNKRYAMMDSLSETIKTTLIKYMKLA